MSRACREPCHEDPAVALHHIVGLGPHTEPDCSHCLLARRENTVRSSSLASAQRDIRCLVSRCAGGCQADEGLQAQGLLEGRLPRMPNVDEENGLRLLCLRNREFHIVHAHKYGHRSKQGHSTIGLPGLLRPLDGVLLDLACRSLLRHESGGYSAALSPWSCCICVRSILRRMRRANAASLALWHSRPVRYEASAK